ncbi:MAG: hypothetical protein E7551_10020 [Ruminococcaceae bacterium]|nr:hypothetical protein [Oscillospiraceae bacterium]
MKKFLFVLMIFLLVPTIVSCSGGESLSSQNTSIDARSSEATNILNTTTSKTEDTTVEISGDGQNSSVNSTIPASSEKVVSNSSKNSTSVISASSNNIGKNNYKQATDSDNNVTVDANGIVSITIPKWFLLKMEPDYNYQLTAEEANTYNFKSVTKNFDGSATFKIGYNDYYKFLLISKSSVNAVVSSYKHNVWFSEIKADEGFNNIKISTKYNSLEDFDENFAVYIAESGIQTTYYQYLHYNYSVGTTITVYNKDNVLLATYEFPDLLK